MRTMSSIIRLAAKLERPYWFVLAAIIFRVALEISYRVFINPVFAYAGFVLDVGLLKYIESWVIYSIFVLVFPKRLGKPSDYFMVYLLFVFLAPLLVFYGLANAPREHFYIVILTVVLIMFFRAGRPLKLPVVKDGRAFGYVVLVVGVVGVTAWMISNGGLSYFNLDMTRVYEFRADAGEVVGQGVMEYINVWATKVFGPILLAIALWKKKYSLAVAVFALHVFWFGVSSHKSVLFYPFLVTFVCVWFRNSRALAFIPIGMTLVVLGAFVSFFAFSEIFAGSLLIRRVFFVPSLLTFTYYDFFSENPHVYWSYSILSNWIEYPYDLAPAKLVGDYLGTSAHANNSFLATGYMHAGILGAFLYGILVGLLFRLIDSLAHKGMPPWVAVAALIVPSHSLVASADLPTALLTHGIGMAIVIFFLLRSAPRSRAFRILPADSQSIADNRLDTR